MIAPNHINTRHIKRGDLYTLCNLENRFLRWNKNNWYIVYDNSFFTNDKIKQYKLIHDPILSNLGRFCKIQINDIILCTNSDNLDIEFFSLRLKEKFILPWYDQKFEDSWILLK